MAGHLGDDLVLQELGREVGDGRVGAGLQARQDGGARQREAAHLAVEALRRAPALQPHAICAPGQPAISPFALRVTHKQLHRSMCIG